MARNILHDDVPTSGQSQHCDRLTLAAPLDRHATDVEVMPGEMEPRSLFRMLVDEAPDAMVVVGGDGDITLVNQQTEALFGYARADLLGQPVELLIPERFRQAHQRHRADYAAEPRIRPMGINLPLFGRRRDGSEFPVEISLSPLVDGRPAEAGSGVGEREPASAIIATIRDVSERQRIERARAEAEAATEELRRVQAVTDVALAPQRLDALLRAVLDRLQSVMGTDSATILLVDADGAMLSVRAARGLEEEVAARMRVPVGQGFAGRIAERREPLVVEDLSTFPVVSPFLREKLRSVVGAPLLVQGRLIGVVHVGSVSQRRFTERDVRLLQLVAERIALAIDRARLDEAAYQSAERLRLFVEYAPAPVAMFDREMRYLSASNRWMRDYGLTGDIRGCSHYDLFPELPERWRAVHQRCLAGAVESSDDDRFELLDGSVQRLKWETRPWYTSDGEIGGLVIFAEDITERARMEEERERLLRQEHAARTAAEAALVQVQVSEARAAEHAEELERILETMADGVTVCDRDGRIVRTNRAYREIVGEDVAPPGWNNLPSAERARLLQPLDSNCVPLDPARFPVTRALSGETVSGPEAELQLRALDGRWLHVNASAAPLRDKTGQIVGAVTVTRDITWRRQLESEREAARSAEQAARAAEQATREVNRRMEQFLATAGHDLRTPVTAALGFMALASREGDRLSSAIKDENPNLVRRVQTLRDRLEDANQGLEHLAQLTRILFDTAAIHTGQIELRRTPCDLGALVRAQVEAQRVASPRRTIRLRLPGNEHIPVDIDAGRIGQVVANFVGNAIKYSPPGRPIEVSVEAHAVAGKSQSDAGWARVAVRDEGPGLPRAEQQRVWEPFHRAPGVTPQDGVGESLGLGLHICKDIIKAHGGQVGVTSEVGHGSTFWFMLPLSGRERAG